MERLATAHLDADRASPARERLRPRRILVGLDAISACISLFAAEQLLRMRAPEAGSARMGYLLYVSLVAFLTMLLVFRDGHYSAAKPISRLSDIGGFVKNVALAAALVTLLGYATKGFFSGFANASWLVMLGSVLVFVAMGIVSRLGLSSYQRHLFSKGIGLRRLLVLGAGRAAQDFMQLVDSRPWLGVSCAGTLDCTRQLHDFTRALRESRAEEVVVALDEEESASFPRVAEALSDIGVRYRIVPSLFEHGFQPAVLNRFGEVPVIEVEVDPLEQMERLFKRVFDIVTAAAGLLFGLPLLLTIAVAILLESGRPVFYRQERVGRNGRHFEMLKYRTMIKDADKQLDEIADKNEAGSDLIFKIREDPRVTKVGRILRRSSLDELPQFVNVLRGEMSIVGPRPPLPQEVSRYRPDHYVRLRGLPGITGLWQVSGRSNVSFEDMVHLDRYYLENWSIRLDLSIVAKTFAAVIRRDGAY